MSTITAPASRGVLTLLFALFALGGSLAAAGTLSPDGRDSVPTLALGALGGGRPDVEDGRGRVRIVHFVATWCEPCRPELASLDRLRAEVGPAGLDVLAISVAEPEERVRRFSTANPSGLTVLLDLDRVAARAWEIEALPSTVILDRAGRARFAVRGDLDWQAQGVRDALGALLAEPAGQTETKTGGSDRP